MKGRARLGFGAGLALAAAAFLSPLLWLFSLSLKTGRAVYEFPPRFVPAEPTLANYAFVLAKTQVPYYLANSAKVAALATLLTLALALPAAFVLSRERFPGRAGLTRGLVLVQLVSPLVLLVPIYGIVASLRLLDTHAGLILVYASVQLPLTVSILRTFCDGLPRELFEAALLDGASRFTTLRKVALPLLGPGLGAATIFNLAAYWAEFSLSLVLLDSQSRFTVPVGLFNLQSGYETEWQIVAAAALLALVPVLAAFVLLQRYFVAGLTAGAVKG
ncbi:MAG: carbohydrate ABC transporter permease [Vicinamibacteria bacterium]